jgi:hypothetical protein
VPASAEEWEAACENTEDFLRLFARVFLDADAYNAVKHGFAVRPGQSRLNVEIDDHDFGSTEGPHLEYLTTKADERGRKYWVLATRWIDLGLVFQEIAIAQRMIDALWRTARWRYLGDDRGALPRLDRPRVAELVVDEAITWTEMTERMAYDD